jgi:hypothetical protein
MKTENILIILALFVVIFLLFSNFSATTPTPIVFQTPSFLSPSIGRGPRPCPFPFGCGGKGRPGRGGWFPMSIPGGHGGHGGGHGGGGHGGGHGGGGKIPIKDTDLVPQSKGGGDGGGYPKDPYPHK